MLAILEQNWQFIVPNKTYLMQLKMELDKVHLRPCMFYHFNRGDTAATTKRLICEIDGENIMSAARSGLEIIITMSTSHVLAVQIRWRTTNRKHSDHCIVRRKLGPNVKRTCRTAWSWWVHSIPSFKWSRKDPEGRKMIFPWTQRVGPMS